MQRTAEEFVHRLPSGRWFVGDFLGTARGEETFLVPTPRLGSIELPLSALSAAEPAVRTYGRKSSAKRAAQRMIERVLDAEPWEGA
jgi:hypothetical protein